MNSTLIMLVDDDQEDREMLSEVLRDLNPDITCISATNGVEALMLLKDMPLLPNYIFMDINMPFMNGKECLKKIKADERFLNIPVIICSTTCYISDIEEMRSLGAIFFLTKPTHIQEIRSTVQLILNPGSISNNTSIYKMSFVRLK
jgi:CheY-like chemotaxis protein